MNILQIICRTRNADGVLALLICLLALPCAYAAEPVKIGVLAHRSKPQTLAQWGSLAAVLRKAVPEHDFVIEALDYPEMDMAVATRQLDFVLTNPGHYILLAKRSGLSAPLATLAEDRQGRVIIALGGAIFSRADNAAIGSLSDLKGRIIAATTTEALSGYQAQAYELKQAGIQLPQDAKMLFTGMSVDNVVEAVLKGRADAGFVRAGLLEDMAREGKLEMAQIKVINRQALPDFPVQTSTHLYPNWPIAALPHVDENISRHVAVVLFRLEENAVATQVVGIHGFVIPADYTMVSEMLRELRLPPFDLAPEFTMHDVWHQYRWWIVFSLFASGLITLLGLHLLVSNRKLNAERRIALLRNQQLDESEQRYRFLFNDNPMPMWVFEEDSLRFLEVNQRALEHYGYAREEFSRMTLRDIWPLEAVPELNHVLSSSPDGKVSVETRHKKKGGMLIDAAISTMPMKFGATPARIVLIQDITERRRAEEELKLSAQILNSISDTVFLLDPDGNFIYLNEAAWKLRGYTREEMMSMNLRELNAPEYNWLLAPRIKSVLDNGYGSFESAHICKDGSVMRVEINARVTEYGGRKVLLSVIRDITERKRAEVLLGEKTRLLDNIIENLPNMIFLKRASDLRFELFNRAGEMLVGHGRDELLGRNDYDFFPKEQADCLISRDRAVLGQDGVLDIAEEPVETPRGTRILHTRKLALRDEQGQPQYLLGISEDITERKQMEEARLSAETRFHMVFDNASDAIVIHHVQGRFIEVNQTMCRRLGYSREELRHLSPPDINAPEGVEKFAERGKALMELGQITFETVHISRDGRRIPVEVSARLIDYDGKQATLSIVRDITQRKEYEEELMRSNTELEQFSYAVSHDMRQPLRMISSYLQLLERSLAGQLDGERRSYFDFAIEGAKRIDQMLVALLEYSRVGRKGETQTWIDSRAVQDEALQFLQPAILEAQAKINISGDWPHILAGHDEILRLIQNLIGNAIKYRLAGRAPEITVTSGVVNNEWRLCIADNGIGIIPDQIRRLFQMFQRLHSRDAYDGAGIGLALCRKIVEHHKGRIWAESAGEGLGSSFHAVLPVSQLKTLSQGVA